MVTDNGTVYLRESGQQNLLSIDGSLGGGKAWTAAAMVPGTECVVINWMISGHTGSDGIIIYHSTSTFENISGL